MKRMSLRHVASIGALSLLAGIPAIAPAQAPQPMKSHPPHVTIAHPIKINTCNPQRGETFVGGGWAPAYYPVGVGPYWGWPAVYGPTYTYYQYPVSHSNPTLGIDYVNDTNVVMKTIEFGLIAHGQLVAEAKDVGTFSPGVEIKHEFGLNPNVFPLATGIPECVPLKIHFEDGTVWKNPHLPALRHRLYGKPH
jgi:hypothetical protein